MSFWYGSGFIPIITYSAQFSADEDVFSILTENNLDIMTENNIALETESAQL